MELTPVQRVITFALVVFVLAGLGVYLFYPGSSGASAAGQPGQPQRTARQSPSPAASPSVSSMPSAPGQAPDIYAWLPFTQSELTSAAQVTVKFAADYSTFSYRQSTASYLAPMNSIITEQLGELIGRAYSTPGVVASRNAARQVCAGSGAITSLRAFGSSSLTFVVAMTERTPSTCGPGQQGTEYAVTVTGSGADWQVSNVELASAGNQ
jgi:hypothetical protein